MCILSRIRTALLCLTRRSRADALRARLNFDVRRHLGTPLPPRELELYRAIDEILWRDWDPIGVFGIVGARDEYQGYLPEIFRLALAGDREKIADYLFWAAADRMGLTTERQQHLTTADRILAAKAQASVGGNDA